MIKDFIAKQPIDVIVDTDITDQRVVLPITVEPNGFYTDFHPEIHSPNLTTEKAIYVAATHETKPIQTSNDLLNRWLKF